jgi:adenylate cyclase
MPKIIYPQEDEPSIVLQQQMGGTILQASLCMGLTHYHACDGQARCTTCRVRVLAGLENLSPRNEAEQKIATVKNWSPEVRLACQTQILGDVTLRRLVSDDEDFDLVCSESLAGGSGYERNVAVMFCDIANFTDFTTKHLPYDVIHLLNRYYKEIGQAILQHHGYIDKYMGDGIMVVFGLEEENATENCRNAILASLEMGERIKMLNQYSSKHFFHDFHIRIGLHYGTVIVGEIGHPSKRQLTVLGDVVNIASRIENENKSIKTTILASQELLAPIQDEVQCGKQHTTQLRGQQRQHTLYEVIALNSR